MGFPLPTFAKPRARNIRVPPPGAYNSRGGGESFTSPFFFAPLETSIVLSRGIGPATYSRASVAYDVDWEGLLKAVLSGEARFYGARRVWNKFTFTEALQNAAWAKVAGGTGVTPVVTDNFGIAPDGTQTATRIQLDIAAGTTGSDVSFVRQVFTTTVPAGAVWMKLNAGSSAIVAFCDRVYPTVTSSWQQISFAEGGTLTDARVAALVGNAGTAKSIDLLVWHPQIEEVAGAKNLGYSEYVSNGVLSAPYHGANVDGVKDFSTTEAFVACWGDSLTTNAVGNTCWPQQLRSQYSAAGNDIWLYEGGVAGETSTQIATRMLARPQYYGDITIIWAGRNNFSSPNTVKADIASMVAALTTTKFIVLSIMNQDTAAEWSGQPNYNTIIQLNADLAALYPNNYLDIRSYLVSLGTNPTELAHDVTPSALRFDALHPNTAGDAFVAARIKTFIVAKGWATAITAIPSATLRGYLDEPAGTQLVTPTASVRDMTNAAWTKTNMTTALTSVGADGLPNSATRCTASAGNATVIQTLVAAATSRTYSAYIRRVTGTGNIEVTQDGATFTNIATQLNSTTYTRVQLNASQLNATFGIRIVTNADAIDVDFNQFEAGAIATSPMASAGAARAADSLTYPITNVDATQGWSYAEIQLNGFAAASTPVAVGTGDLGSGGVALYTGAATDARITDGTAAATKVGLTDQTTAIRKRASSWSGVLMAVTGDGASVQSAAFDGNMSIGASLAIGGQTNGGNALNGTIKNARIGKSPVTDAQIQAFTA